MYIYVYIYMYIFLRSLRLCALCFQDNLAWPARRSVLQLVNQGAAPGMIHGRTRQPFLYSCLLVGESSC